MTALCLALWLVLASGIGGWHQVPPTPAAPLSVAPSAISEPLVAVRGFATWYDACGSCAAAGPALRRALGSDWRGSWVKVSAGDRSVRVRLSDWCACSPRHGTPTVIDLSRSSFRALAPLGQGVVRVIVETTDGPGPALPPTDTGG